MKRKALFLTQCAMFAALTAVFSQISFPAGPFPFSMGIFAVMLCGGMLKPLPAFVSQAVYLFIGGVGLPVFSGFQGGVQCLFGPTGGFLLTYPLCALIISALIRKGRPLISALGYGAALLLCYGVGAGWYALISGVDFLAAATVTALPFVIPDVIKAVAAHIISSLTAVRLRLR